MSKGQLKEMRGRYADTHETNQAMISTKWKHIKTLAFKIEMKEDAKTDLHAKY